jgi:hypothetical protein
MAGYGRHELAISALLTSGSITEASQKTGLSERTIYRYLRNPEFQSMFKQAKMRLLDGAISKLRTEASGAVDVLAAIAHDRNASDTARVAAARSILQFAVEYGQTADIEERLQELEAKTIDAVEGWTTEYPMPQLPQGSQ